MSDSLGAVLGFGQGSILTRERPLQACSEYFGDLYFMPLLRGGSAGSRWVLVRVEEGGFKRFPWGTKGLLRPPLWPRSLFFAFTH